jgi:hypothetical protein
MLPFGIITLIVYGLVDELFIKIKLYDPDV